MISPSESAAILTAAAAVLTAIAALFVQIRKLEARVDGRLTELLEMTRRASKAEGVVEGVSAAHGLGALRK